MTTRAWAKKMLERDRIYRITKDNTREWNQYSVTCGTRKDVLGRIHWHHADIAWFETHDMAVLYGRDWMSGVWLQKQVKES